MNPNLPDKILTQSVLDELLTEPVPRLVDFISRLSSPLLILGAGGKMGPTLAGLAQRAAVAAGQRLRIVAVSRFNDGTARDWLEGRGIETLACDLFERKAVAKLPDSENVLSLAGLKFGTSDNPAATWATNTIIPSNIAERFAQARIVALSTGNVYPLVPVASGGARENHPLTPLGEYANAAVARERLFEWHARRTNTRMVLVRLFYALEMRYGVLHDLAQQLRAHRPIDVAHGYFKCIWQRDANEMILRCLDLAQSPPLPLNLAAPPLLSIRSTAERLAELMGTAARFQGQEAEDALFPDVSRALELLGPPAMPLETVLRWTADWVQRGGRSLNKPTHFEVRNGQY